MNITEIILKTLNNIGVEETRETLFPKINNPERIKDIFKVFAKLLDNIFERNLKDEELTYYILKTLVDIDSPVEREGHWENIFNDLVDKFNPVGNGSLSRNELQRLEKAALSSLIKGDDGVLVEGQLLTEKQFECFCDYIDSNPESVLHLAEIIRKGEET